MRQDAVQPFMQLAAYPYLALNRLVRWSFESGLRQVERASCPVISVGNLTSGGTGKSSLVRWLAQQLQQWGRRPAIALRGYRGTKSHQNLIVSNGHTALHTAEECGDEALEHAHRLPGVPVLVGRDRAASARIATEQLECDTVILDDGFQYWRLHRDLDIVLVDAGWLSGDQSSRHFPRETLAALSRAHLVLLSKGEELPAEKRLAALRKLEALASRKALVGELETVVEGIFDIADCRLRISDNCRSGIPSAIPNGDLQSEIAAVAFAGIADNESFFSAARRQPYRIVETVGFADHHRYSLNDVARLNSISEAAQASFFLTTEKDAVKLNPVDFRCPLKTLRVAAKLELAGEIEDLIARAIGHCGLRIADCGH